MIFLNIYHEERYTVVHLLLILMENIVLPLTYINHELSDYRLCKMSDVELGIQVERRLPQWFVVVRLMD